MRILLENFYFSLFKGAVEFFQSQQQGKLRDWIIATVFTVLVLLLCCAAVIGPAFCFVPQTPDRAERYRKLWAKQANHAIRTRSTISINVTTPQRAQRSRNIRQHNTNDNHYDDRIVRMSSSKSNSQKQTCADCGAINNERRLACRQCHHLFVDRLMTNILQSDNNPPMDEQCSICMDEFIVSQSVTLLPCAHRFHTNCIIEWLNNRLVCPLCNQSLERKRKRRRRQHRERQFEE